MYGKTYSGYPFPSDDDNLFQKIIQAHRINRKEKFEPKDIDWEDLNNPLVHLNDGHSICLN